MYVEVGILSLMNLIDLQALLVSTYASTRYICNLYTVHTHVHYVNVFVVVINDTISQQINQFAAGSSESSFAVTPFWLKRGGFGDGFAFWYFYIDMYRSFRRTTCAFSYFVWLIALLRHPNSSRTVFSSLLENESPDVVVSDYASAAPFEICRTKKTLWQQRLSLQKPGGNFVSKKRLNLTQLVFISLGHFKNNDIIKICKNIMFVEDQQKKIKSRHWSKVKRWRVSVMRVLFAYSLIALLARWSLGFHWCLTFHYLAPWSLGFCENIFSFPKRFPSKKHFCWGDP